MGSYYHGPDICIRSPDTFGDVVHWEPKGVMGVPRSTKQGLPEKPNTRELPDTIGLPDREVVPELGDNSASWHRVGYGYRCDRGIWGGKIQVQRGVVGVGCDSVEHHNAGVCHDDSILRSNARDGVV